MRFLVDECTGQAVANWLREQGYDTFSVYEAARGLSDTEILFRANQESRVLITNDKDFGEKVYREKYQHKGIIFMRLEDERAVCKIQVLKALLDNYADKLVNHFVVITENQVRFRRNV